MNLITLFMYLFAFKKDNSKGVLGNDNRFPPVTEENLMPKIVENYKKKILLDYLSSDSVNIYYKIKAINMFYGNNPKPLNLTGGGLFKDWNFEI